MERGFLSQQGSGGGRGVTEKDLNRNKKNTSTGIGVTTESDDTMNDDNLIGVASAIREGVTPSVVGMTAGNAPGKSSYANITGRPSAKKVNVRTLFTPRGNGIDVVVPVDSIRVVNARFANTAYGFFLGKKVAYSVVANYVRNTWGLDAMLENGSWFIRNNPLILKKWHPDENLLKEDVSTVPVWDKLHGVPVMAFSEDGLSVIATKLDGSDKGYGTNSFLEQWRDSYPDNDDYDPYDDDMYENHDLSEHLQFICDDLDITVRDRKKK
ncbi:zinc finger, CCHC-type containing protein [Tanacetum coccineum]